MHKVANKYLNVRVGAPSTAAPCSGYLDPSMGVDVVATVTGTMIDGNNIWFKDERNNYYWSGGFESHSFSERLIYHLRDAPLSQFICPEDLALLTVKAEVQGIGWGMDGDQCYIDLFYSGHSGGQLPKYLTLTVEGDQRRLPVRIRPVNGFSIHGALQPSDMLKNRLHLSGPNGIVNTGSMGYFVRKRDDLSLYGITCYHVARSDWNAFDMEMPGGQDFSVLLHGDSTLIGHVIDGFIDEDIDAALIALEPAVAPALSIPLIGRVTGPRDITCLDIRTQLPVFMFGGQSTFRSGRCTGVLKQAAINYGMQTKVLQNLIVVENEGHAISQGGDSGSWVVDEHNAAIGMVVAGGNTFTLVIPIRRILTRLKVSIANA